MARVDRAAVPRLQKDQKQSLHRSYSFRPEIKENQFEGDKKKFHKIIDSFSHIVKLIST